jgi:hypothetical protein
MPTILGMVGSIGIGPPHRVHDDGNNGLAQGDTRETMVGKEMEKAKMA